MPPPFNPLDAVLRLEELIHITDRRLQTLERALAQIAPTFVGHLDQQAAQLAHLQAETRAELQAVRHEIQTEQTVRERQIAALAARVDAGDFRRR